MLRGVIIFYLIDNMLGKCTLPSPAISRYNKKLHDQIVRFQPLFLKLILYISVEYFRTPRILFKNCKKTVHRKKCLINRRDIGCVGICCLQGRYFAHHTKMHLNVRSSCFHVILIMYFVYEYHAFGLEIVVDSIAV